MNTINNNGVRTILTATALCAALAAGARAEDARQVHVSYADLNLNTAAGATVLYQRIREAASNVCALPVERDLGHVSRTKACMARVIAEAVETLDNPAVSRVYEQKSGMTPAIKLATR